MVKCKYCKQDMIQMEFEEHKGTNFACLCGTELYIDSTKICWVKNAYDIIEIKKWDKDNYSDAYDYCNDDSNFEEDEEEDKPKGVWRKI
jgi:hypothetical protein